MKLLGLIGYASITGSYLILMYLYLMTFPPDQRMFKLHWTLLLSAALLPWLFLFIYILSRDDVIWP